MACACKVNQQIDYLHKKYGDNIPKNKKTNIAASVENAFVYLLLIPLVPFMLVYVLVKAIMGKNIHLDKIFKLKADV